MLLASLDSGQIPRAPVDGIMIGYNPPIVLQRPGLLEAAWAVLKPGGRLCAVGARCTTPAGRIAGPPYLPGAVPRVSRARRVACWARARA